MNRKPLCTSGILAHQQILQRASEANEPGWVYEGVAERLDVWALRELVAETLTANATHRAAIACNDAIGAKAQSRLIALDELTITASSPTTEI